MSLKADLEVLDQVLHLDRGLAGGQCLLPLLPRGAAVPVSWPGAYLIGKSNSPPPPTPRVTVDPAGSG